MERFLFIIIISLFFLNCNAQKLTLEKELANSFTKYITDSRKNQSELETKRYLDNEAKFIIEARKYFFSQIKLEDNIKLIEIINSEVPSELYTAVLKLKSKFYLFKKNSSFQESFKEIKLEDLENHHQIILCMLQDMDKYIPYEISNSIKKSSYHFTIYLTKVNNSKILIYTPNDICIDD